MHIGCSGIFAKYGSKDFDLVVVSAGRLDFQDEFWQIFASRKFANFDIDQNIVHAKTAADATMGGEENNPYTNPNMARIAAGFGHVDYTQSLRNVDLTNFVYFYDTDDLQVGIIQPHEVAFLNE